MSIRDFVYLSLLRFVFLNPGISGRSQDPNNVEQPLWVNRWYGESETLCLSEVALSLARPWAWDRRGIEFQN